MARELLEDIGEWYVPDIEGNREDPKPFRVRIKSASTKVLRELEESVLGAKVKGGQQPNVVGRANRMQDKLIADHVTEVENYAVKDLATGEALRPKNGAELVDAITRTYGSERAVLADIADAITESSKLAEGVLGNSGSP